MVVSMSMQDGSYDSVLRTYTKDSSGHIQINHPSYIEKPTLYKTVPEYRQLIQQLESLPYVQSVTPRIHSAALAYGADKTTPGLLVGIDPIREQQTSFLANKVKEGAFLTGQPDADGYYQAMVGKAVAEQLQLSVGSELVLITQGADGSMANDVFLVSGVVGARNDAERLNIYLPMGVLEEFLVMPNQAHRIVILVDDYLDAEGRAEDIRADLADQLNQHQLSVAPWQVVEAEFYRLMKVDRQGAVVSLNIVVFLVCIGVLNTILMNILERTGEFGVLKAIGTSPSRIFAQILLESLVMAIASCGVGFLIALPLNYWLTHYGFALPEPMDVSGIVFTHMTGFMNVPVFLNPILIICGATLVIACIPAYRAARIVPLDAMRRL